VSLVEVEANAGVAVGEVLLAGVKEQKTLASQKTRAVGHMIAAIEPQPKLASLGTAVRIIFERVAHALNASEVLLGEPFVVVRADGWALE
jgi:hypothetical protein